MGNNVVFVCFVCIGSGTIIGILRNFLDIDE